MDPSHAGGMALLTNRQLIIFVFAVMPESCTNTGADTLIYHT